jgi:4-diphosphocytidyl-2-C-methyl-D-erythritol kinase
MELKAYAKINWDLRVLGKRADGFHALDTVMVNVNLHDTLTFTKSDHIELTCSDPNLAVDESNLVVKAARILARASRTTTGARIHLDKNIPMGGGMGGGSSDAACTLQGLNKLWNLNYPLEKLQPLAAEIGSDVAFFLYGGWRRCLGRGEIVEALDSSVSWPQISILLVLPPLHVPTPLAYKCLQAGSWDGKSGARSLTDVKRELEFVVNKMHQQVEGVKLGFKNDLTNAARKVEPRLETVQRVLEQMYPERWLMSGSGAVHFAVPDRCDDGSRLREALEGDSGPGIRVLTATTFTP